MYGPRNDYQRVGYVLEQLNQHLKDVLDLKYNVFAIVVQGSQNYNLDLYTDEYKSDVDTKCLVIPTFDQFCRNNSSVSFTHIRSDNSHVDIKDVASMFQLFKKQNVQYMEILFSEFCWIDPKYRKFWNDLMSLRNNIANAFPTQLMKTLCGMSMEKYKALTHPYPTIIGKINKHGYDGKQLHHIIRLNEFMKNYMDGMPFKDCLTSYSLSTLELMMEAKLNHLSLRKAENLAKKYNNENVKLKEEFLKTHNEVMNMECYQKLDELKVSLYKEAFKEEILDGNRS